MNMKYLYTRIGSAIIATSISLSLLNTPAKASNRKYQNTNANITSIEQNTVSFINEELKEKIEATLGTQVTTTNLNSITRLEISQKLTNNNLSDLKYLPNLETLIIANNDIDLFFLTHNPNLKVLNITNGAVTNIAALPESLTSLHLNKVTVPEHTITFPSNIVSILLHKVNFKNIKLTNPEKLLYFYYSSYEFFDLQDIQDCTNLQTIIIKRSPNILNSEVLTNFKNVSNFYLDEQATLWLTKETAENINLPDQQKKEKLLELIDALDEIANSLNGENKTEKEKINAIILYVIQQIEYDYNVYKKTDEATQLAAYYNDCPISSSLNADNGVCVNYACLFRALANRLGIPNYQITNYSHTWNMVKLSDEEEYMAYDLTQLDSTTTLVSRDEQNKYYYNCYFDKNHDSTYYFETDQEDLLYYYKFYYATTPRPPYQPSIFPCYLDTLPLSFEDQILSLHNNPFHPLCSLSSNQITKKPSPSTKPYLLQKSREK